MDRRRCVSLCVAGKIDRKIGGDGWAVGWIDVSRSSNPRKRTGSGSPHPCKLGKEEDILIPTLVPTGVYRLTHARTNRHLRGYQAIQISALGVLRRVCQHKAHGPVAADTLATLGAVKSLMDLVSAYAAAMRCPDACIRDAVFGIDVGCAATRLELLLEASKASEKLRRTADQVSGPDRTTPDLCPVIRSSRTILQYQAGVITVLKR
eukprot:1036571-Rhodomonas_salina.1